MKNKIDAYQMGRDAAEEIHLLPALRFPLEDNKIYNRDTCDRISELAVNPFPKGEGPLKQGSLHGEWRRGFSDKNEEILTLWMSERNFHEEG